MIKIYAITVSFILVGLTFLVATFKPEMSKPVQFSKNELQVTTTVAQNPKSTNTLPEHIKVETEANTKVNVVDKIVKTVSSPVQQTSKEVGIKQKSSTKTIEVKPKTTPVKTVEKVVKKEDKKVDTKNVIVEKTPTKVEQKEVVSDLPKSVKEILQEVKSAPVVEKEIELAKDTITVSEKEIKPVELPKIESKPIEQMTPDEIIKQAEKEDRLLNEREEVVVWNVWRSNLQNQIMQDTQVSAPLGTVFKFSFTVDKKGRISNLRTWAQPSMYNSVAINYLKPLIQSYQGKPILNFPSRTKRVITNVTGGFTISTEDRFSKPSDFSDIERIKTVR